MAGRFCLHIRLLAGDSQLTPGRGADPFGDASPSPSPGDRAPASRAHPRLSRAGERASSMVSLPPGTLWVWERAPRGYPVRVCRAIREEVGGLFADRKTRSRSIFSRRRSRRSTPYPSSNGAIEETATDAPPATVRRTRPRTWGSRFLRGAMAALASRRSVTRRSPRHRAWPADGGPLPGMAQWRSPGGRERQAHRLVASVHEDPRDPLVCHGAPTAGISIGTMPRKAHGVTTRMRQPWQGRSHEMRGVEWSARGYLLISPGVGRIDFPAAS